MTLCVHVCMRVFIRVCVNHMCDHSYQGRHAEVRDNFLWNQLLTPTFTSVLGIELRPQGMQGKSLYSLSHLTKQLCGKAEKFASGRPESTEN